ncbi:hypothetical protein JG536_24115 [Burkholderia ambifaria]|uniref:hypothetical protein n=1 Tax=Burkholderia ambifaria TaxID=152480 RepID=UPI00158BE937|nr:hypothetical protein [Burkholderia ambifaria]QQJ99103.1 hypothetical protein JG536_24115 [Burkholderia ambifaria]
MRKLILLLLGTLSLLLALAVSPSAEATTTTLNFDTTPDGTAIPSNTILTDQYQSIGVLSVVRSQTGVVDTRVDIIDAPSNFLDVMSRPNVAYSSWGLMTFTLNAALTGNVRTVSAYIEGAHGTGIYAYDASDTLVGQTVLPVDSHMAPFSVTSSGNPITTVLIQGSPGSFYVDNLSFISDVPFAKYAASVYLAPKVAYFAASESFTLGAGGTRFNPPTQAVTLTFGSLTLSIPAGSFTKDTPPRTSSYVAQGALDGGTLYVSITPTKTANTYQLFALGAGYTFPTGLSTLPVALSIGDNDGHTNTAPNYVPHVPTSP